MFYSYILMHKYFDCKKNLIEQGFYFDFKKDVYYLKEKQNKEFSVLSLFDGEMDDLIKDFKTFAEQLTHISNTEEISKIVASRLEKEMS